VSLLTSLKEKSIGIGCKEKNWVNFFSLQPNTQAYISFKMSKSNNAFEYLSAIAEKEEQPKVAEYFCTDITLKDLLALLEDILKKNPASKDYIIKKQEFGSCEDVGRLASDPLNKWIVFA
jgi:hypothetical protein